MALNWNVEDVANWQELFVEIEGGYREMIEIHERILRYTMTIGIGRITEKNWKKFYDRVYMWERVHGTEYYTLYELKPIYVTEDDVKRMIGLRTNVSDFPKTEFLKNLSRGFEI